ncbi:unnamed protein product [Mytilus edulis]|uniref:Uncharacterized protein n=1 Tax=Mytilus edulis TaxID=6550 RepID=A0A8S3TMI6_MYTED|nr:unnamed protein product [Mytilus edulis]
METKIRHIRKFIQNVQTPQSRHIDSHTTTHTLNPETIPFVPTHNIANPHNAQSFENPSVQASHTFNTQQRPTYGKELNTSNDHTLNISHVAVEYNPEKLWNSESIGIKSKEIEENDTYIKAFARLAWKEDSDELPTNSTVTKKRIQNVTTRLIKTPDMLKGYGEIIQEHKGRRFRKKVTKTKEISRKANPDHPVNRKSSTTRIRMVNNCRKRKRWKCEFHMLLREFLRTSTGLNYKTDRKIISVGRTDRNEKLA